MNYHRAKNALLLPLRTIRRWRHVKSDWNRTAARLGQEAPQITPEWEMRNIILLSRRCVYLNRAEREAFFFSSKAKTLVSVITWPCCGGNAYYAVARALFVVTLRALPMARWGSVKKMRRVTTGTALGKRGKKATVTQNTVEKCAFSPIFWPRLHKRFPRCHRILTHNIMP